MYIILLLVNILLWVLLLENKHKDILTSYLKGIIITSAIVYCSTEVLSFFNAITPLSVIVVWAIIDVILLFILAKNGTFHKRYLGWRKIPTFYKGIIITAVLGGFCPLLFLSIYSPPNNVDSINYHLTRIIIWMQNQNINHFPTLHIEQLYHNVMVEYIDLHIWLLSGNDYFLNLLQYVSMLSSIVAAVLIGKFFGVSTPIKILIAILLFAMPIGIMESTTTQVDYVSCLYFLCFVYFALRYMRSQSRADMRYMGLALVLGCFSKYTIFFYAAPFCIWIAVHSLLSQSFIKSLQLFLYILLLYVLVFAPFFYRNLQLFGHPIAPPTTSRLNRESVAANEYGFRFTLSNTAKNIGLHLGLPTESYNRKIDTLMGAWHRLINVNINDPHISYDTYKTKFSITEDQAGNFILLLLIIVAFIGIVKQPNNREQKLYALCTITGFLLFCSALKFQYWSSRTHIPFFALGTVAIGIAFDRKKELLSKILMVVLLLSSIPYIYANPAKPLLPFRYMTKYALGYTPIDVCVLDKRNFNEYKLMLNQYYNFDNTDKECFIARKTFSYLEGIQIVKTLDKLNYYATDNQTIFEFSRGENYFVRRTGGEERYKDFMSILSNISPHTKTIAFKELVGFYDYWAIVKQYMGKSIEIQYIGYPKEFQILNNERKKFEYEYIITDDNNWINNTLSPLDIEFIVKKPTITLVKLKKKTTNRYVY